MFLQQRVMSWCLVIEEEVLSRCADPMNTRRSVYKCVAASCSRFWYRELGTNGWSHRVAGEDVLDVGQEQFLVLLFVVDTKKNEGA
jgi:hypothetical protein